MNNKHKIKNALLVLSALLVSSYAQAQTVSDFLSPVTTGVSKAVITAAMIIFTLIYAYQKIQAFFDGKADVIVDALKIAAMVAVCAKWTDILTQLITLSN